MDIQQLKALAERRRNRREAMYAIVLGVGILALIAFLAPKPKAQDTATTVATSTIPDTFKNVAIQGHAAIVYDVTTGQTLYAYNADAQLPLASLTKLLTVYAASKALAPDAVVAITPKALAQTGDAGDNFALGEQFTFDNLARYTLVSSSNQGAEAIAEAAAAAQNTTDTGMLASAAAAAGLSQTYALNGTGLDESATVSGGYGSARDIATFAAEFLTQVPDLAAATVQPSVSVPDVNGTQHAAANTDIAAESFSRLLLSKTGNTDLAGGNLAIVFDAGVNHPVAIVVLGSTQAGRFQDVQKLMDATTAHFALADGGQVIADGTPH
jgi:D-alanyl-D-alanine carboxypeptidase